MRLLQCNPPFVLKVGNICTYLHKCNGCLTAYYGSCSALTIIVIVFCVVHSVWFVFVLIVMLLLVLFTLKVLCAVYFCLARLFIVGLLHLFLLNASQVSQVIVELHETEWVAELRCLSTASLLPWALLSAPGAFLATHTYASSLLPHLSACQFNVTSVRLAG